MENYNNADVTEKLSRHNITRTAYLEEALKNTGRMAVDIPFKYKKPLFMTTNGYNKKNAAIFIEAYLHLVHYKTSIEKALRNKIYQITDLKKLEMNYSIESSFQDAYDDVRTELEELYGNKNVTYKRASILCKVDNMVDAVQPYLDTEEYKLVAKLYTDTALLEAALRNDEVLEVLILSFEKLKNLIQTELDLAQAKQEKIEYAKKMAQNKLESDTRKKAQRIKEQKSLEEKERLDNFKIEALSKIAGLKEVLKD